jgi:hypothetical protein
MRWPKSLAGLLLMFAVVSGQAGAQETRNEVAGSIGRTFISDQTVPNTSFPNNTVHFGKSTPFEINYARELLRFHWGVLAAEVPTVISLDHDLNYGVNQIPKEYKSVFITPAARISFPSALPFAPWLSFGGGIGHFQASRDLVFFGTNPGPRVKTTGVLQGGVGVDIDLPGLNSIKFRFEARDHWSGVPPLNVDTGKTRQHNYYVGGGVVGHF